MRRIIARLCLVIFILTLLTMKTVGQNTIYPQPAWNPDGTSFAIVDVLSGHSDRILNLAWSPRGDWLASYARDQTIHIWDISTFSVKHILQGHDYSVSDLLWHPDGNRLISMDSVGRPNLFVWDVNTGSLLFTRNVGAVHQAVFDENRNHLIYGTLGSFFEVLDGEDFTRTGVFNELVSRSVGMLAVTVNLETGYFITGGTDGSVRVWDPNMLEVITVLPVAPDYQPDQAGLFDPEKVNIRDVQVTPDREYLLVAVADGTIQVRDMETYEELMTRQIAPLLSASFSPSGARLVKVAPDLSVAVEDTTDLLPAMMIQSRLMSTSSDRAVFCYNLANNGNIPVDTVQTRVYFTPDGTYSANDYVLNLTYDSTQSISISGPFSPGLSAGPITGMNQPHYFEVVYSGLQLNPGESWQAELQLRLTTSEVGFDATNDWWYTNITPTATETAYLPVYARESLITGQTPTP